jgi:hypothetical protein
MLSMANANFARSAAVVHRPAAAICALCAYNLVDIRQREVP